jgi:homospermidine synthase
MDNTFYDKYKKYKNKYEQLKDLFVYKDFNTYEKRKNKYLELLNNKINFDNKIYIIGFGAIGNALLWLLLKLFNIKDYNITIIEKDDKINFNIDRFINKFPKIKFLFNIKLTRTNYKTLLKDIKTNDIVIDCAYDIGTTDLLIYCNEKGASHINSCIQTWNNSDDDYSKNMNSLYEYHKDLENVNNSIKEKNFNLLVSMGCNPGNVSLWVRQGIIEIAKQFKININDFTNNTEIQYNKLAQKLNIQTIHISEKDTQISSKPKDTDEYCNTWSKTSISYYGELLSTVELSWGTHEQKPNKSFMKKYNDNFIILNKMGLYTYSQSWIPFHNKFIGNVICHDETYTIGNKLTIKENDKIIYKPSIYYVYKPCNDATNSLYELKEKNESYQNKFRLLTSDIISGKDLLGLTYFLENSKVFWIGSTLDITETRNLFDNEINDIINATILQVIVGYITGIIYINDLNNKNEKKGLIVPDEIPLEYMKYQLPFLGNFIFVCENNYLISIVENNIDSLLTTSNNWIFNNFIID